MPESQTTPTREFISTMANLVRSCNPKLACMTPMEFCLVHGREYDTHAQPGPDVPAEWKTPKECYRNAYMTALEFDLEYVEGWAVHMIPTEHAWCVDAEGHVIDPTWGSTGHGYFGVPIPIDTVHEVQMLTGIYSILSAFWQWPDVLAILKESVA